MSDFAVFRAAGGVGDWIVAGLIGLAGLIDAAFAPGKSLPNAPLVPTISLNEGACGAAYFPALPKH